MRASVIGNRVPTPEEMGEILGLSSERVNAVRRIMNTDIAPKPSRTARQTSRKAAAKPSRGVAGKR